MKSAVPRFNLQSSVLYCGPSALANLDSAIGAIAPDRAQHRAADLSLGHASKPFQQVSSRHLHAGDINADRLAPGAEAVLAAARVARVIKADVNGAPSIFRDESADRRFHICNHFGPNRPFLTISCWAKRTNQIAGRKKPPENFSTRA